MKKDLINDKNGFFIYLDDNNQAYQRIFEKILGHLRYYSKEELKEIYNILLSYDEVKGYRE